MPFFDKRKKKNTTMRIDFMASAKQIAWRKKFARMSKDGKFKKPKTFKINKKSGSVSSPMMDKKYKAESIAQLEKRLDMMLQKGGFDINGNFKAKYDPQFLAGIEKLQKLKRE